MLKIFFTSEDIARTRLAPTADPLWEMVLSAHMLRPQRGDLLFRTWRRLAGTAVRHAIPDHHLQFLFAITPTTGYFPDFINPSAAIRGLEHGLEAIRSTPKATLRQDLQQLARTRKLPQRARQLAAGEPEALTQLTDTMRTCYHRTVVPYRRAIDKAIDHDRRTRTNALASAGVEGLLTSLRPMVHFSNGELRVPSHRDQELHLNGRGLLLIPSYFCLTGPTTLFDPLRPPVLVYPVSRQPHLLADTNHRSDAALAALIGPTRAAVLQTIGERHACTTTELARRVGIAAATASEHTAVLRQAGLITSQRDHNRMLHHPTALGLALLHSPPPTS